VGPSSSFRHGFDSDYVELLDTTLKKHQSAASTPMVFELHIWGPAFGLPSIDAECIAVVAYLNRALPQHQWKLVANHDASLSPNRECVNAPNLTMRML